MQCFTINEQVAKGIIIKDEPALRIGAEGYCSRIPLNKVLTEAFEVCKSNGQNQFSMPKADLSTNTPLRLLPEKPIFNRRGKYISSDIALVHIATTSPGQLWLEANCYEEEVIKTKYSHRVRRAYLPFPGGGVDVIAVGTGANGEPNALVRMVPGSTFRICRDTTSLPPDLLVIWPGTKLKIRLPWKHQQKQDRARIAWNRKHGYDEAALDTGYTVDYSPNWYP